jgi:hypothetical protein
MRFSTVLKALAVLLPIGLGVAAPAEAAPLAKSLLTPDNHILVLVDHQPQKGLPALTQSAVQGIEAMPPKGNCEDCIPSEIEAAIRFMAGITNP